MIWKEVARIASLNDSTIEAFDHIETTAKYNLRLDKTRSLL